MATRTATDSAGRASSMRVDEDAVDALTWYNDADTDGYGDPTTGVTTCVPYLYFPWSYTPDGTDCDDGDVRIHPFSDSDVDGFLGCDDDCDDGNPDINPSVFEEGCSTVDLDCNGTAGIDEPTADCQVAVAVVNDGVGFTVTITVPAGFDAWATAGFEPATITLEPEDTSYSARSADYAGDDAATVIALGRTGFTPYATDADGSTAWADMSAWYVDEAASDVRVVIYPDNTGTAANFLFAY
ncbi:hypothetical protein EBS80_01915 [bacterium]|nr:hypothetical protein [bacterium]